MLEQQVRDLPIPVNTNMNVEIILESFKLLEIWLLVFLALLEYKILSITFHGCQNC